MFSQNYGVNNPIDNQPYNSSFMDAINIASFVLGIQNMGLNITTEDLERNSKGVLNEVHRHLAEQDKRLSKIEKMLEIIISGKVRDGGYFYEQI